MSMVRNLFQREGGKSILFIFFLDFCPSMAYNNHMKGVDYMDKRAITDRLDYAIRLIQYVRDNLEQNPQELIVARRLLLEAYNKSKAIKEVTI